MATPSTGNTPTGDAAAANIAADSSTGTAKSANPTAGEAKHAETSEQERSAGEVWTSKPVLPEGEEEDNKTKERAKEENDLRAKNPNEVVYRAADTEL